MIREDRILNFIIFLIILNILILSIFSNHWGYDEFGAVVTNLELSDPYFRNEYVIYLKNIGINNEYLSNWLISYLLPFIIVPLRWTYAIGISPLLGAANFLPLEWQYLRPVLMIPYILLMGIGLILIKNVLSENIGYKSILVFYLLLFSSSPFMYWSNTLTSYSYHTFLFGVILYATLKCDFNGYILSKKSILFSIIPIFNYQYIPMIFLFGILDFITNVKNKGFLFVLKSWLMPALTCLFSVVFIVLRAKVSGKHLDPAFASLDVADISFYSIPSHLSFSWESTSFILSRYYDIVSSFYIENVSNRSSLSPLLCLIFLTLCALIFSVNKKINKKLSLILISMIAATLFFQFVGMMPVTPKRHQLVFFLPIILLFSVFFCKIFIGMIPNRTFYFLYFSFILGLVFLKIPPLFSVKNNFPYDFSISYFKTQRVERLILNQCDYEPILFKDIRVLYDPIYRCGPKIIKKLPAEVNKIAVWSSNPIDANAVREVIGDYSPNRWKLSYPSNIEPNSPCIDCSNLWIAELLIPK